MTQLSLILVPLAPLVLLIAMLVPALRRVVPALAPWAALPALWVAVSPLPGSPLHMDWLLLGTVLDLTETGRAFLFFTALLWGLATWQAAHLLADDPKRDRFTACLLAAMMGNFGLLMAQDIASFYTFFSAMSLSAWGLVLHTGGAAQRFAGKVYIGFAMVGEIALFAGLAIGAFATGEATLSAMTAAEVPLIALVLASVGFLAKLGTVPLHLWLPPAHSAAPAPASAVLSGAMLKAGLFGLLTILPLGSTEVPVLGAALAALSVAGLIIAPALGLVQGDAKAVLAYSSIGQTSLMTLGLAVALMVPEAWALLLPAVTLLVVHHGFAKAALFLGVPAVWSSHGRWARAATISVLALPALVLAGVPWSSGFVAKSALDGAFEGVSVWGEWLAPLLLLGTVGTSLLMLRALVILSTVAPKPVSRVTGLPALGAVGLSIFGLWLLPSVEIVHKAPTWLDLIPFAGAGGLALLVTVGFRWARLSLAPLTPGHLLAVVRQDANPRPTEAKQRMFRSNRPLAPRRSPFKAPKPERGGLTILGAAAVLTLAVVVTAFAQQRLATPQYQPATETVVLETS